MNVILLITFILNLFNTLALIEISQTFSRWMSPVMWNLVISISGITMVAEVIVLALLWTPFQGKIVTLIKNLTIKLSRLRSLNLLIIAVFIAIHGYFVFGPIGQHTRNLPTFLFSYWIVTLLSSILLKAWSLNQSDHLQISWTNAILIASLITTLGHVLSASLSRITDYPFTRDWSETSRYYYASLFFSKRVYGIKIPLPVLHPSEYLTLSVPYLLPSYNLWIHRAWQYFVSIAMPLITAILLSRRLAVNGLRRMLLVIWIILYLGLGPVYYHLLVPISIVIWGYDTSKSHPTRPRLLKASLAVGIASIWAGISRVNWFPVPGLLAATLYLLENPLTRITSGDTLYHPDTPKAEKSQNRVMVPYLIEPIFWVILGTIIAIVSYGGYILISGNPLQYFATTYTSDLLWYRLLPNSTYPPGILTGILVISLPLFLITTGKLVEKIEGKARWQYFHPIRFLSLGMILFMLFVGGLFVSTKIGGGSNLHNMDAFIIILMIITTATYFDRASPDFIDREKYSNNFQINDIQGFPQRLKRLGLTLSTIILAVFTLIGYSPPDLLPMEKEVKRSAQAINKYMEKAMETGSSVLFISNRHMLNFNYENKIQLIPEYERIFLMEMAMAGDEEYLNQFYNDLENRRFDMIIVEPLYDQEKGIRTSFGEENDIWVERISKPILCHYEEQRTLRLVHIQILVPRTDVVDACP